MNKNETINPKQDPAATAHNAGSKETEKAPHALLQSLQRSRKSCNDPYVRREGFPSPAKPSTNTRGKAEPQCHSFNLEQLLLSCRWIFEAGHTASQVPGQFLSAGLQLPRTPKLLGLGSLPKWPYLIDPGKGTWTP